jgi:competence protein ComEC
MQDGWLPWRAPRVVIGGRRLRIEVLAAAAGWGARFQQAFEAWLDRVFARFPGWLGLERSVWLGDTQALPPSLLSFYQRGGLLHLLSLSGQRVHALLVVAGWGLRAFLAVVLPLGLWRFSGRPFRELHRWLPFLCCGLLCLTSHGTGPLRRTLVMWGAMLILRWRRLEVAPLQWVCSSVACLIVADPTAIANPGVFLSAVATGLMGVMHDRVPRRSGLVGYLLIQSFLPILVFPLGAFFFAQVAWLSPLHSVVLAWTWTLAWVPLAVASLFVLGPLPSALRDPAVAWLEFGWNWFVSLQQAWSSHMPSGFTRVIRPTWLEWGLVESLLLLGALAFWRWAFRAAFPDD